jgi:hypothetical protein
MPAVVPLIVAGVSAYASYKSNQHTADTQAAASQQGTAAQEKAAAEALAFQKQQYANTQKAVSPYQQYGAGALAALGSGLGVHPDMSQGVQPTNPTPHTVTNQPVTYDTLNGQTVSKNYIGDVLGDPNGQTISGVLPSGANSTQQLSQSSVRLQSPDGKETQTVPASQAQYYISHGAKVVQ